jgi:hypothetical protein
MAIPRNRRDCFTALLLAITISIVINLFISNCAIAGGPFVRDVTNNTGVAQQWTDNKLTWFSDDGDLSNGISHETAMGWLTEAIGKWTGSFLYDTATTTVKTTSVTNDYQGSIGKDIDISNFDEYVSAQPGETVIIFDKDGAITEYFAGGAYTQIPGLSQLLLSSDDGTKIIKGVVILNGVLLDNRTLSEEQFKAAVLHELGHLFNLDHAQVNEDIASACSLRGGCTDGQYIPTMYPELKTWMQSNLVFDDMITISWIYPNENFKTKFCTITGEIQDRDGRPLQGVNVIARRVGEGETIKRMDSRSMVSGVLYDYCYPDGHYYLHGIRPGKTYEVFYEPLSTKYRGMSGFEPLPEPPSDFDTGTITTSDGSSTVSCSSGGQTIEMPTVKIDVSNPCPAGGTEAETAPASAGGGCSLILPR